MNISTGNLAVCAMESFNNRSMQILDFPIPGSRRMWLYSTRRIIRMGYDVSIAGLLPDSLKITGYRRARKR